MEAIWCHLKATGGNNIVEVFERLETSFWTIPFFSRHLGAFDALTFNVILTITNAISKNLPPSGTKCLPIMSTFTYWGHRRRIHIVNVTYGKYDQVKKKIQSIWNWNLLIESKGFIKKRSLLLSVILVLLDLICRSTVTLLNPI